MSYGDSIMPNLAFIEHPGKLGLNVDFSEKNIALGAKECVKVLEKRGFNVTMSTGFSFGAALATIAAIECKIAKLVLLSPFSSFPAMVKVHNFIPFLEPALMTVCDKYQWTFNTVEKLRKSNIDLKIFHGQRDCVIDISNSYDIIKSYGKEFDVLDGQVFYGHYANPYSYTDYLLDKIN